MSGLTSALLVRASKTFLMFAYPGGRTTIPPGRRAFAELPPDVDLAHVLVPPLCETLCADDACVRGYVIRLGSAVYPHLKLRIDGRDEGRTCVFAVETHDSLRLGHDHPDARGWERLQIANRELKERIERTWEAQGLLTFNGLLRRGLDQRPAAS